MPEVLRVLSAMTGLECMSLGLVGPSDLVPQILKTKLACRYLSTP